MWEAEAETQRGRRWHEGWQRLSVVMEKKSPTGARSASWPPPKSSKSLVPSCEIKGSITEGQFGCALNHIYCSCITGSLFQPLSRLGGRGQEGKTTSDARTCCSAPTSICHVRFGTSLPTLYQVNLQRATPFEVAFTTRRRINRSPSPSASSVKSDGSDLKDPQ